MPIDPSIALSGRPPQFESPLNMMGQMTQIQAAQSENSLRKMQMEKMQQDQADEDRLNRAWGSAVDPITGEVDQGKLRGGLATSGLGAKIPAVEKSLAEIDKLHNEGQAKFAELVAKHMAIARQHLEGVTSPAQYMQHMEYVLADPVMRRYFASLGMSPQQIMAQSAAKVAQAVTTPTGFSDLLRESKLGADKALEVTHADLGDRVGSFHKYGGEYVADYKKGIDPTAAANGPAPTLITIRDPTDPTGRRLITVNARNYTPGTGIGQNPAAAPGASPAKPPAGVVGESKDDTNAVKLDERSRAAREAAYPKAKSTLAEANAEFDNVLKSARELLKHPGLSDITGPVYGRTPNITESATGAQALLDNLSAKGQFGALSKMRAASPTGGALGNVSDTEGRKLADSFAVLKQSQSTAEFRRHLSDYISEVEAAKARANDAFEADYEYRKGDTSAGAAPAKGGKAPTVSNW